MIRTAILCTLFDICLNKMFEGILAATYVPSDLTGRHFPLLVINVDGDDYPPCYGWEVGEALSHPEKDYNTVWGHGTCTFTNARVEFVDEDGDLFVVSDEMCFKLTFIRDDAAMKYEAFCREDDDNVGFKQVSRTGNTVEIWLKDWHLDGYYVKPVDIISPRIND